MVTIADVPDGKIAPKGEHQPGERIHPRTRSFRNSITHGDPWPAPRILVPNGAASVVSPSFNRLTSFISKIDQTISCNNSLTGRYFFGDSVQSFPLALTASGGQLPGFNTYTPTRVQLVSLSWVHTIGLNKVNEMRYGWNRFAEGFFPADQSFQPSSIGLCAASTTALCNGGASDSGLPIIAVSGVAQFGATSSVPRHGWTAIIKLSTTSLGS